MNKTLPADGPVSDAAASDSVVFDAVMSEADLIAFARKLEADGRLVKGGSIAAKQAPAPGANVPLE